MHRIDVPSASTSLPAPRAYGTPGYFQEGNPLTGVDATIVDEDWTNAVQEELVAIVLAAGMSLDKTNRAQVLAAIRSLIAASHGLVAFWGTGNFTVPTGITAVDVELWGDGAGSFASYGSRRSGGGGAGGYVRRRITGSTPFQVIVVTIGGGGIAGTTTGPSWPSGGGTSSFGSYISATGGALNGLVGPDGFRGLRRDWRHAIQRRSQHHRFVWWGGYCDHHRHGRRVRSRRFDRLWHHGP